MYVLWSYLFYQFIEGKKILSKKPFDFSYLFLGEETNLINKFPFIFTQIEVTKKSMYETREFPLLK